MPHCRMAVENYLYEKLGPSIFMMYTFKNRDKDEKFEGKQRELKEGYQKLHGLEARRQMMEFLGVKKQF